MDNLNKNDKITITAEQYEKLNDYFNELCLGLSVNDTFLLDNIVPLGMLSANILTLIENIDSNPKEKEDCLSFLEIYDKAKDIIKEINPNYVDDFSNIMRNGILEADYDRLNIPYSERKIGYSNFDPNIDRDNTDYNPEKGSIHIGESFNYDAVSVLIHEYFHKTNFSNNRARYLLTEYISIYFELYTYELLKKQGISNDKLSLNYRLYDLKLCADFLSEQGYYLFTFDQLGKFNKDTYKNIKFTRITENEFNLGLLDRLKEFEKYEKQYTSDEQLQKKCPEFKFYLASKYDKDYRYFICTLLAYYSLYNINKEKVLKLNEELANNKEITFNQAMNILGFEFTKENEIEIGKAIKRYADENDLYQINHEQKKL